MSITDVERAHILSRLAKVTGRMTTATVAAMEQRHGWFSRLDAEHRSWITLVARAGIDGFVAWFADPAGSVAGDVFDAAPRAIMRRVSLQHAVDLVRTTIAVCEEQIQLLMPRSDREVLSASLLHYSREIAFAAAAVYAHAAELRGTWDARLEAMVVDAIVRGDADEAVISRASTLGWRTAEAACVVVGSAPPHADPVLEDLRRDAHLASLDVLASIQGDRLVLVLGGRALEENLAACLEALVPHFGPGTIAYGRPVEHIIDAGESASEATSALRTAVAWPQSPRLVSAQDLLPERALAGDPGARAHLSGVVFATLAEAGGDLLETLEAFFEHSGSVEGTGRALFVHANTVRYRLKRIREVTSYSPTVARDAYVLRVALTLGRLISTRL